MPIQLLNYFINNRGKKLIIQFYTGLMGTSPNYIYIELYERENNEDYYVPITQVNQETYLSEDIDRYNRFIYYTTNVEDILNVWEQELGTITNINQIENSNYKMLISFDLDINYETNYDYMTLYTNNNFFSTIDDDLYNTKSNDKYIDNNTYNNIEEDYLTLQDTYDDLLSNYQTLQSQYNTLQNLYSNYLENNYTNIYSIFNESTAYAFSRSTLETINQLVNDIENYDSYDNITLEPLTTSLTLNDIPNIKSLISNEEDYVPILFKLKNPMNRYLFNRF